MKKLDIARRMARKTGVTSAEAADRLDGVVHQILTQVRQGKSAPLPGVGKFQKAADGRMLFVRERSRLGD